MESHREHAQEYKACSTVQQQRSMERQYGCRYTVLLELPYYDVVRMCIVDPMHNLLLGTTKHMMIVWKAQGILIDKHLALIQKTVDSFVTPSDVGRIPTKIASGFSGFTADQWRNWTLLYSLCSLKPHLPHNHYNCWLLFVKACHILCRRSITSKQLDDADSFLITFCQKFVELYGQEHCTMNMHLHGHIKDCILDFGPVYSFWLFSFERLNGVLGSYHTNCHDISVQLMRRFRMSHDYGTTNWPEEYKSEFAPLLSQCRYSKGALVSSSLEGFMPNSDQPGEVKALPPVHESTWLPHQKEVLRHTVRGLVGHDDFFLLSLYQKCKAISVGGTIIGASNSRYTTSAHVMALHPRQLEALHLAKVQYLARVDVKLTSGEEQNVSYWFAAASFYHEHQCKLWFGRPTEVWATATLPDLCLIHVNCIKCRVAYCKVDVDFGRFIGQQTVIAVSPLSE